MATQQSEGNMPELRLEVGDIVGMRKSDQRITFISHMTWQRIPFPIIYRNGELDLFRPLGMGHDEVGKVLYQHWLLMLPEFLKALGFETEKQEALGGINFIITKTPY